MSLHAWLGPVITVSHNFRYFIHPVPNLSFFCIGPVLRQIGSDYKTGYEVLDQVPLF